MTQLQTLERAGLLSVLDVELARGLARIAGEKREEMLLTVALASRNLQQGHVCFDLSRAHADLTEQAAAAGVTLPSSDAWLNVVRSSPLVVEAALAEGSARPLVMDDRGRLYLARYHDHERALAARLRGLAARSDPKPPVPREVLEGLFPPRSDERPDLQRLAALSARTRRLSVIVGGPGTGKTSTVVKLLALLAHDAKQAALPLPRVLLVAPTGKAAQRLTESIEQARAKLAIDSEIAASIPSTAQTIHRALGSIEGSLTQFRHHGGRPLSCDVLLLDEASMVDLALMRRLLDAVPEDARVIMLGDPDQLVSVEAGGVLTDLCRAAERGGPLAACVTRLTESHRYAPDSGIAALSEAIRTQDVEHALALLSSGDLTDIDRAPSVDDQGAPRLLLSQAKKGYADLRAPTLEAKLSALSRFRVLCAHRKGRDGVEAVNAELTRALTTATGRQGEHYPGRPILITQNDYGTSLFNGDVGVLHSEGAKRDLALYLQTGDHTRRVALGRLPAHETVYAMSVHKSQGSEFDRVAVVLPERVSPVLTRELLFTAITRARSAVTIYASTEVLRATICQRVERESGLMDRLVVEV